MLVLVGEEPTEQMNIISIGSEMTLVVNNRIFMLFVPSAVARWPIGSFEAKIGIPVGINRIYHWI